MATNSLRRSNTSDGNIELKFRLDPGLSGKAKEDVMRNILESSKVVESLDAWRYRYILESLDCQ